MAVYRYAFLALAALVAVPLALSMDSGTAAPSDSPLKNSRALAPVGTNLFEGKLRPVPELAVRTEISNQAQYQVGLPWEPENYENFEKFPEAYRTSGERTPSGVWKLSKFYASVESDLLPHTMPEVAFEDFGRGLDRWLKKVPDSATAVVYNSIAMLNYANTAIFLRLKNETITQERLDEFYSRTNRAEKYLVDHHAIGSKDPHFYKLLIDIMAMRGATFEQVQKVLAEGSDRHPYYYEIYFSAIRAAMQSRPEDFGADVASIVAKGVEKTSAQDGTGFYARAYWHAAFHYGYPPSAFPLIDWQKMRAGMNDVFARHGDTWNANNFARFACLARDSEAARQFLPATLALPAESIWDTSENLQKCVELSGLNAAVAK